MSKKDLFDNIQKAFDELASNGLDFSGTDTKRGRDMGGEWLTIAFTNREGEREAYTIEAERIN